MDQSSIPCLLDAANSAFLNLNEKFQDIECPKKIDQALSQIQLSLNEINKLSSQVQWKEDNQNAKIEENSSSYFKNENDSESKGKAKKKSENNQNQDPSFSLDKKQRGPYRQYTSKLKQNVIQLFQRGLTYSRISRTLGIPSKNIVRWCREGPQRKPGAGRKVLDPEMEQKLFKWIKSKFSEGLQVSTMQIRRKAKQLSKISQFEGSPGWLKNFERRYGLKDLYKSYS